MTMQQIHLDGYLGQAFDNIPVAMIVVNAQGDIVRLNRLAESIFGYSASELEGRPVEVLIPSRYHARHKGYRHGFMAETNPRPMGAGRDLSGLRKDGSEFPVEIGINPVETGEGPMVLSVILDLSERKQNERRIQDALQQKDVLLKEVHHRVKNNLQVIHSLLDLQALTIKDEGTVGMLRDSQNRIRSMSMIHQTLYQSQDFAQVDFDQFLGGLLPRLMESYASTAGHVTIDVQAQDVQLPINEAIPCGLIVNELVSNALKHGFLGGRRGSIQVTITQREDKQIEMSISNDGHPIPDKLALNSTGSLGLQLVHLLTQQLRGELTTQHANPTCFTLRFGLAPTA
ncbi:sensor histidine kinase [Hydrogenophaga sp.]|uniref:sensor histidine kinase n=1 Tax=Hydrogenophaga sp. TaxID=1904254 RepID=UPI0027174AC9|nr:histidine kinase dimerization/phosphoacceptor domain -containing protein [Hydrogenophaga sp.]MDO8904910.1 histidine kinase dimerization/phosphoacceptor domain -containing protein [Hydrogenophaga sp.]